MKTTLFAGLLATLLTACGGLPSDDIEVKQGAISTNTSGRAPDTYADMGINNIHTTHGMPTFAGAVAPAAMAYTKLNMYPLSQPQDLNGGNWSAYIGVLQPTEFPYYPNSDTTHGVSCSGSIALTYNVGNISHAFWSPDPLSFIGPQGAWANTNTVTCNFWKYTQSCVFSVCNYTWTQVPIVFPANSIKFYMENEAAPNWLGICPQCNNALTHAGALFYSSLFASNPWNISFAGTY